MRWNSKSTGTKLLGKASLRLAVPALALLAGMPLLASSASVIAKREQGYDALGTAYKIANDSLRGGSPDMDILRSAARTISLASRLQYSWFPAGSGPGNGASTAATAKIWTDSSAFRAAQDRFATKAKAFEKAVATGNVATIRSASRSLGASCKSCHDKFRLEKD